MPGDGLMRAAADEAHGGQAPAYRDLYHGNPGRKREGELQLQPGSKRQKEQEASGAEMVIDEEDMALGFATRLAPAGGAEAATDEAKAAVKNRWATC